MKEDVRPLAIQVAHEHLKEIEERLAIHEEALREAMKNEVRCQEIVIQTRLQLRAGQLTVELLGGKIPED